MKGVALVSGDFVRTGGMDVANFALAKYLADCGESVELVAYRVADELAKHSNVVWRKVPKPANSYLLGAPLLDHIGRRVAREQLAVGGRAIVNGGNCQASDINWVHFVHAAYEPNDGGPSLRRARSLLTRRLNLARERLALRAARLVIANSERTRRDLIQHLGVEDERIRTVYLGVDRERFAPPSEQYRQQMRAALGLLDRPQVAFVGALGDRRKGFDTLFAAWSRLCRDPEWDCDLVVVGAGAELNDWRERARADTMSERIRFLGFRKDVPDVLAACDAMAAPARYEPFGLGVQEALCTGLPALVSATAGVAELYPAQLSGLLLQDPVTPLSVEAGLREWRKHLEGLLSATRALSERLRQRTWQEMAKEICSLIK